MGRRIRNGILLECIARIGGTTDVSRDELYARRQGNRLLNYPLFYVKKKKNMELSPAIIPVMWIWIRSDPDSFRSVDLDPVESGFI